MGIGVVMKTARLRAIMLLVGLGTANAAGATEIRIYCTGATAAAVKAIAVDFSSQTKNHPVFTVGQPAAIEGALAACGKADVVILPAPALASLTSSGALRADSAIDVARGGIGFVVRSGAPRPDISKAAAIRQLLLDARSVVYSDPATGGGSAGRAIAAMIDRMGVAAAVKPKLMLVHAIGGGVDLVAAGKAEI